MSTVIVMTPDELTRKIEAAVNKTMEMWLGAPVKTGIVAAEYDEVSTQIAKKMLKEKGYSAKSCAAFNGILEEHGITGKKRGRDNWYERSKIEAIPNKR